MDGRSRRSYKSSSDGHVRCRPLAVGPPRILQAQYARIGTLLQREDVSERSGVPDERGARLIGRGQVQRELLRSVPMITLRSLTTRDPRTSGRRVNADRMA